METQLPEACFSYGKDQKLPGGQVETRDVF